MNSNVHTMDTMCLQKVNLYKMGCKASNNNVLEVCGEGGHMRSSTFQLKYCYSSDETIYVGIEQL